MIMFRLLAWCFVGTFNAYFNFLAYGLTGERTNTGPLH